MKRMKRKISAMILVFALILVSGGWQAPAVQAAGSVSTAETYTFDEMVYGTITGSEDPGHYYKVTLPESGKIEITGQIAGAQRAALTLYNEKVDEVWNDSYYWNSTAEIITVNEEFFLTSGVYYFKVGEYWGYQGDYQFSIHFTSSKESFRETQGGSNNTIQLANTVKTDGTKYRGQIARNDEKDFYTFTLADSGKVTFDATFKAMKRVEWTLYDEAGEQITYSTPYWNDTTRDIVVSEDLELTSGKYYLSFSRYDGNGAYDFSLKFKSAGETYHETNGGSNNDVSKASALKIGTTYKGQLALNDDRDFYKLTAGTQPLCVQVNADMERVTIKAYDASGNELWDDDPYWNSTTRKIVWKKNFKEGKGTYYISISGSRTGNYTLRVAVLTKDNCDHDYHSEYHAATYFAKGYTRYTCSECGDTYKAAYTNKSVLSAGYLSRYGMTGKNYVKLSRGSVWNASGYQIRYSTSSKMKKSVKTKKFSVNTNPMKVKKLKRKTAYYFQIRAYVKSGKKIAYGGWSTAVRFKTR